MSNQFHNAVDLSVEQIRAFNNSSETWLKDLPPILADQIKETSFALDQCVHAEDLVKHAQLLLEAVHYFLKTERKSEVVEIIRFIIFVLPEVFTSKDLLKIVSFLIRHNELEDAMRCLETMAKSDDIPLDIHYLQAQVSILQLQYERALEYNTRAIEAAPSKPNLLFQRGDILLQLNRFQDAENAWVAAFRTGPDPEIAANTIVRLAATGSQDNLVSLLSEAIRTNKDDMGLHLAIHESFVFHGLTKAIVDKWLMLESDRLFQARSLEYWSQAAFYSGYFENARLLAGYSYQVRRKAAEEEGIENVPVEFVLPSAMGGLGSIATLGFHIKLRKLGWKQSQIVVLQDPEITVNPALLNYFSEHISIVKSPSLISSLSESIGRILTHNIAFQPHRGKFVREDHLNAMADTEWKRQGRDPLLKLKESDRERGWRWLESLGMPSDGWFITLHARENPADHRELIPCRDIRHIKTYFDAINEIRRRGGWVIRIGDPSMTPIPRIDGVIDLASSPERKDWMDVFAWAECRFYIGTNSGPGLVPRDFGRNSLMTNWVPLILAPGYPGDVFLPKLFWHVREQRFLTFEEAWSTRLPYCESSVVVDKHGCQYIENEESEILEAVIEMFDRQEGRYVESEEDQVRQKKFASLALAHGGIATADVCSTFLRKYKNLL